MQKRAIVTGANGFIGSWLCKELTENGYHVIAVVRNKHSNISAIEKLQHTDIIFCNMYAIHKLPRLIDTECESFFHFAWEGTAGEDRGDYSVQLANIESACSAIEAAKNCGCKRFIHAGSLMEFESFDYLAKDFSKPDPSYIYKISKMTSDFFCKTVCAQNSIDYINLIISNTYGEGEISPRFISSFLRRMLKHEECALTPCEQPYDFIYISDAVRAMRLVAEKGNPFCNYYIGNKEQYKLKEFVLKMKEIAKSNSVIKFGATPFTGVDLDYKALNPQKLYDEFGFVPQVSFEEGIKKTIQWLKENNNAR